MFGANREHQWRYMSRTTAVMTRSTCIVAAFSLSVAPLRAQQVRSDSATARKDTSAAACSGGRFARAFCKGVTGIYRATTKGGLSSYTGADTVAAPSVPVLGTYRIQIVRNGSDSLTYYMRTRARMYERGAHKGWTEYLGGFVSAMSEDALPEVLDKTPLLSMDRLGSGNYFVLFADDAPTQFGIKLNVSPPPLHPAVREATPWLRDVFETWQDLDGWDSKDRKKGLVGTLGDDSTPARFSITWKIKKNEYVLRGTRLSAVSVNAAAAK